MTQEEYCFESGELTDLYIHNELDGGQKDRFDSHISVCGKCRLLLDGEAAAVEAVKRFGDETPDIVSTVMKYIIENKITVDKPKRRFGFAPSLIPAAVAVIAVMVFSRTNIMRIMDRNFGSADSGGAAYGIYDAGQTEMNDGAMLNIAVGEADDNAYDDSYETPPGEVSASGGADEVGAISETREFSAAPEAADELYAYAENEVNIQDITDEYDADIFNGVKGRLKSSGEDEEEAINTLIVLNGEDEELLEELLQDIEYENINGIIKADISALNRFLKNSTDNNYDDFKIYQENEKSNVLAITVGE